jgi:YtkA-like
MRLTRIHWILTAVVVAVIAIGAYVMSTMMTPPGDLDMARSKPSEQKAYVAALTPEREPLRRGELHAWVLTLTTPDGKPVEGATIAIDGGMPQHGHGLPTSPQMTTYLGEGRYRIEGVKFNMGGWWELKFAISASPGDDRVTFNLVL